MRVSLDDDRTRRGPPLPECAIASNRTDFSTSATSLSATLGACLLLLQVVGAGCSRSAPTELRDATAFVCGPPGAGLVVFRADGRLERIDADGKSLAGPIDAKLSRPNPTGSAAPVAPVVPDVVFAADGSVILVAGRARDQEIVVVSRWAVGAEPQSLGTFAAPQGLEITPSVAGTRTSGVLANDRLALVGRDATAIRGLWVCDLANGETREWPGFPRDAAPAMVSISPRGDLAAVFVPGAGGLDLVVLDADGKRLHEIHGVELVAPYWLSDVDALLYVRVGGAVFRLSPHGGQSEWLANGGFTTGIARPEVTSRIGDSTRVTIERIGFEGVVQVFELAPFEVAGDRERALTSGKIDHFGAVWSSDHRFLVYRQRVLIGKPAAFEERIIAIDTAEGSRSATIATRDADAGSDRIGPAFLEDPSRLFLIVDGKLVRADLGDGPAPDRDR